MGKKSGPSPPDPVETANAQAQANIDAATANAWLNNANTSGPYGSVNYTQTGTQRVGVGDQARDIPTFTVNTQLSPNEQALYDASSGLSLSALQAGQGLINNTAGVLQTPYSVPTSPQQVTGVNAGGVQTGFDPGGPIASSFNMGPQAQTSFSAGPAIRQNIGGAGEGIQGQLNRSGLPGMPGLDDFTQDRERYFQATMSRQNQDIERERAALEQRLANQGVTYGTEAWQNAMDDLTRRQTDAVNAAYLASGDEQARMFGMASQARAQQFGEEQAAGAFANTAQAQRFGQTAAEADFYNRAAGQQFDINRALADFFNQGQAQNFDQAQAEAAFYNNAQDQAFAQNQAQAVFGNQAQGQLFGQGMSNAQLQNAGRQQAIQESLLPRTQAVQEIASLFGLGGQPNLPQFQQFGSQINPGDIQGNAYATYQGNLQRWQQASNNRNQLIGALAQLGSSAISSMAMSDARFKTDIEPLGTRGGHNWYRFRFLGDPTLREGVMAQEVAQTRPDAVASIGGILHVDYGRLGLG